MFYLSFLVIFFSISNNPPVPFDGDGPEPPPSVSINQYCILLLFFAVFLGLYKLNKIKK